MGYARIAVAGSCSGSGKTTLARLLAARLDATFVEMDALYHGPNWTSATPDEFRGKVAPIIAGPRWVTDGLAQNQVGSLILDRAELVIWLDLPPSIFLPRLVRRSWQRWWSAEPLWHGNRETIKGLFFEHDGLFPWALKSYFGPKRAALGARLAAAQLAGTPVVRLCTPQEVAAFTATIA